MKFRKRRLCEDATLVVGGNTGATASVAVLCSQADVPAASGQTASGAKLLLKSIPAVATVRAQGSATSHRLTSQQAVGGAPPVTTTAQPEFHLPTAKRACRVWVRAEAPEPKLATGGVIAAGPPKQLVCQALPESSVHASAPTAPATWARAASIQPSSSIAPTTSSFRWSLHPNPAAVDADEVARRRRLLRQGRLEPTDAPGASTSWVAAMAQAAVSSKKRITPLKIGSESTAARADQTAVPNSVNGQQPTRRVWVRANLADGASQAAAAPAAAVPPKPGPGTAIGRSAAPPTTEAMSSLVGAKCAPLRGCPGLVRPSSIKAAGAGSTKLPVANAAAPTASALPVSGGEPATSSLPGGVKAAAPGLRANGAKPGPSGVAVARATAVKAVSLRQVPAEAPGSTGAAGGQAKFKVESSWRPKASSDLLAAEMTTCAASPAAARTGPRPGPAAAPDLKVTAGSPRKGDDNDSTPGSVANAHAGKARPARPPPAARRMAADGGESSSSQRASHSAPPGPEESKPVTEEGASSQQQQAAGSATATETASGGAAAIGLATATAAAAARPVAAVARRSSLGGTAAAVPPKRRPSKNHLLKPVVGRAASVIRAPGQYFRPGKNKLVRKATGAVPTDLTTGGSGAATAAAHTQAASDSITSASRPGAGAAAAGSGLRVMRIVRRPSSLKVAQLPQAGAPTAPAARGRRYLMSWRRTSLTGAPAGPKLQSASARSTSAAGESDARATAGDAAAAPASKAIISSMAGPVAAGVQGTLRRVGPNKLRPAALVLPAGAAVGRGRGGAGPSPGSAAVAARRAAAIARGTLLLRRRIGGAPGVGATRSGTTSLKLVTVNGQQYYAGGGSGSGEGLRQLHSLSSVAGRAAAAAAASTAAVATAPRRSGVALRPAPSASALATRRSMVASHAVRRAVWRRRGLDSTSPRGSTAGGGLTLAKYAAAVAARASGASGVVGVAGGATAAAGPGSRRLLGGVFGGTAAAAQRILAKARMRRAAAQATKARGLCPDYCRTGTCARSRDPSGARCPHVHDPSKIAVCAGWLSGSCKDGAACPLQHRRVPHLMPLCSYFLQGKCTATDCPYLHKTHPASASVCWSFLNGHCPRGVECSALHLTTKMARDRARLLGSGAAKGARGHAPRQTGGKTAGAAAAGMANQASGQSGTSTAGGAPVAVVAAVQSKKRSIDHGTLGGVGVAAGQGQQRGTPGAWAGLNAPKRRKGGFRYFDSLLDEAEVEVEAVGTGPTGAPSRIAAQRSTSSAGLGEIEAAMAAANGRLLAGREADGEGAGEGKRDAGGDVEGKAEQEQVRGGVEGAPLLLRGGMKLYL